MSFNEAGRAKNTGTMLSHAVTSRAATPSPPQMECVLLSTHRHPAFLYYYVCQVTIVIRLKMNTFYTFFSQRVNNKRYTKRPINNLFQEKLRTAYFSLYLAQTPHLYLRGSKDIWVCISCFTGISGIFTDAKLFHLIMEKTFLSGGSATLRTRL